jgi:hypothetical protein
MVGMTSFKRTDTDRVSPRQAAERLTDIAYALTVGGPLQLTVGHERVTVPLGHELRMQRGLSASGDCVELELQLSWPASPSARGPGGSR